MRPLVGRTEALAVLERALEAVAGGRPLLLRVAGEPGIGKSRLLSELAARADDRGMLVLEGRAAEFEQHIPCAPFLDALDDYLTARGSRWLERLGPRVLAQLAEIIPAAEDLVETPPIPLPAERYRTHQAMRTLLDELACEAPLVLVLDDAHWADPASTELLLHLIRHPPTGKVLVALAHRRAPLDERLANALERAAIDGRSLSLELGPLSRAEADALIGARVRAPAREELYEQSGGNPFYLEELVRAANAGDRLSPAGGREGDLPAPVSAAIAHELAALTTEERLLAKGAAVTGQPFDATLAALAAAIPEHEALFVLDRLVDAGLVHTTEVPRRLAFRHPVVRRAVYEAAGPGWRVAAHKRLAAALRERGASAAELAPHITATAQPGDDTAIALLTEAGNALASRAPAIAARHFHAALGLLPAGAGPRRLEPLMALAGSLAATGDLMGAHAALTEALALLPPGSPAVQLVAQCAALEHLLGRHEDAHARLLQALDALPVRRSADAASLLLELAAAAIWAVDFERVTELTSEARELAIALDEPALRVQADALAAFGDVSHVPSAAGSTQLDAGIRLAAALDNRALAARLDALYYLAFAAFFRERFDDCRRLAERALQVTRETGQGHLHVHLTVARAAGLMGQGRIPEASEAAENALDGARLADNDLAVVWAGWVRCLTALHVDLELALATGQEVAARAARVPSPLVSGGAGWILGLALLEAGDPTRARRLVIEAAGGPELPAVTWSMRCLVYELLARADLALGRIEEADAWAERAEATAAQLRLGVAAAQAGRARAAVTLAQGDPAAAAQSALAAAEAAEGQGAPVEAARARTLAGRALAADGDREQAGDQLERALTTHERCGATRHAEEATRELRRLGRRIGRGGRRGLGKVGIEALSGRELQIAELVADGLTNREIASRLFLSEKTVERHLTHVFGKLGVRSRAAVARTVAAGQPRAPT